MNTFNFKRCILFSTCATSGDWGNYVSRLRHGLKGGMNLKREAVLYLGTIPDLCPKNKFGNCEHAGSTTVQYIIIMGMVASYQKFNFEHFEV